MSRRIAYLGPPGTYSEQAVLAYDGAAERSPFPSVMAAAAAVEQGKADEAVVAIENSIEGSVTDTLDMLIHDSRLSICKELVIPIDHCVLAKLGQRAAAVEVVYSHSNALGQCREYLAAHYPRAGVVASLSTVKAVEDMLASARPAAAIAPRRAADLYKVDVLAEGIQDRGGNVTRFVVLAQHDSPRTGDDKTSIAFSFAEEDKPGQLYRAMGEFANRGINLSKIESRPSKESLGRYVFLVDLAGHREDAPLRDALAQVASMTIMWKIFGSYPRFRRKA
ncbi:MAG: prephenate dehydratase [Dehalococcoidia bacterium]|nr:prephenate dehydratase [Dehalococcoidia bacterium]